MTVTWIHLRLGSGWFLSVSRWMCDCFPPTHEQLVKIPPVGIVWGGKKPREASRLTYRGNRVSPSVN
jgi:hypothetical protein